MSCRNTCRWRHSRTGLSLDHWSMGAHSSPPTLTNQRHTFFSRRLIPIFQRHNRRRESLWRSEEPRIFLQEVNDRLSMSGDGLQRLQQRFCLAIKAVDIINDLFAQPLLLRDWAFSEEHCHLTA